MKLKPNAQIPADAQGMIVGAMQRLFKRMTQKLAKQQEKSFIFKTDNST